MTQALSGIRIIDMTHNQAGPACTQILGFLGADVIKLEEPKGGDIARTNMRDKNSDSLFFLILNANKRSLTLNLKTDEGKELFKQVIAKSDVLVENFGPGALDRPGPGMRRAIGVRAALQHRHLTGRGQHVEVSMQDAVVNLIRVSLRDHQRLGRPMGRTGNQLGRN